MKGIMKYFFTFQSIDFFTIFVQISKKVSLYDFQAFETCDMQKESKTIFPSQKTWTLGITFSFKL